ncbi:hypothetical protein Poli38472_007329 [Pythium oligandrum]|uniref:FYVE-type domain-containing protein n=1 Tax=Pythium oligandrum TaxID=41045 RepID=A0A8K1C9H6_PYTOL|nr:hypothetical protein Poli38472_007329 [Pythium oligandrum]|eukprot:TMW59184.1 hypothetical protein Poli38472_007329 [Pythium oligandrum]
MHLRFPLPEGYFPKFELTPDESVSYKDLVAAIVKQTRREYSQYVGKGERQVDSRTWNHAKTKDRINIYKRRSEYGAAPVGLARKTHSTPNGSMCSHSSGSMDSGSEASFSTESGARQNYSTVMTAGFTSPGSVLLAKSIKDKDGDGESGIRARLSSTQSHQSSNSGNSVRSSRAGSHVGVDVDEISVMGRGHEPAMLAVGVLEGTVDDIVYALHDGTALDIKGAATLTGDDSLIDCAVLHTIKQNKTTYLGLKWKLTRTPGGNRDMCFIEYVGVALDSKGERYGFQVLESVKLHQCPAFADNSIIRTDISFCYLFRESGQPGIVDVFMQGSFDSSGDVVTAGGVGDSRSTMEMLMSVETCMDRAEAKKLRDLVAKAPAKSNGSGSHCSICRSKPGLLSSHVTCQGCAVVICTKCRLKKVILAKNGGKQKIACCKICVMNVNEKSPFEGEVISQHEKPPSLKAIHRKTADDDLALIDPLKRIGRTNTEDSFAETDYSASMQSLPSSSVSSSYSDIEEIYTHSPADLNMSQLVISESSGRGHAQQMVLPPVPQNMPRAAPQQPANMHQHRVGLYNQMLELQMQAEKTYNLTSQNAAFMQQQQHP